MFERFYRVDKSHAGNRRHGVGLSSSNTRALQGAPSPWTASGREALPVVSPIDPYPCVPDSRAVCNKNRHGASARRAMPIPITHSPADPRQDMRPSAAAGQVERFDVSFTDILFCGTGGGKIDELPYRLFQGCGIWRLDCPHRGDGQRVLLSRQGRKKALLIRHDDWAGRTSRVCRSLTPLPVTVVMHTTGNFDHIGGAVDFDEAWIRRRRAMIAEHETVDPSTV